MSNKYFDQLIDAAIANDNEAVKYALSNGADASELTTPYLHLIAKNASIETLQILLKNGADFVLLLLYGAHKNEIGLLKRAFNNGANPSKLDGGNLSSIAQDASVETLKLLLQNGADASKLRSGHLSNIAKNSSPEILKALLENGADASKLESYELSDIAKNSSPETLELLLKNGADASRLQAYQLSEVARNSSPKILKVLLENGADASKLPSNYLYWIAQDASVETLKLLLKNGVDASKLEGSTISSIAQSAPIEALRLLLKNGADASKLSDASLYSIIKNSSVETLELLIENGANINNICTYYLSRIIKDSPVEKSKLLIENGVDFSQLDLESLGPHATNIIIQVTLNSKLASNALKIKILSRLLAKKISDGEINDFQYIQNVTTETISDYVQKEFAKIATFFNKNKLEFLRQVTANMVKIHITTCTENKTLNSIEILDYLEEHHKDIDANILLLAHPNGYWSREFISLFEQYDLLVVPLLDKFYDINIDSYHVDGILLPGAADSFPTTGPFSKEEASLSLEHEHIYQKLLEYSDHNNVPLLGICAGLQHIALHKEGKISEFSTGRDWNKVELVRGSLSHYMSLDSKEQTKAIENCKLPEVKITQAYRAHSFAVNNNFSGKYTVSATAGDGVIMSIVPTDRDNVIGFQFHPEKNQNDIRQKNILKTFADFVIKHHELGDHFVSKYDGFEIYETNLADDYFAEIIGRLEDCTA